MKKKKVVFIAACIVLMVLLSSILVFKIYREEGKDPLGGDLPSPIGFAQHNSSNGFQFDEEMLNEYLSTHPYPESEDYEGRGSNGDMWEYEYFDEIRNVFDLDAAALSKLEENGFVVVAGGGDRSFINFNQPSSSTSPLTAFISLKYYKPFHNLLNVMRRQAI